MVASEKLYELKVTLSQVMLRVTPPGDGRKANLNDIQKELNSRSIPYRHNDLFEIYRRAADKFELLSKRETEEYEVIVEVAHSGLEASLKVVPPSMGNSKLDYGMIKQALVAAKIQAGIQQDEIRGVVENKIENKSVVVAKGREPVHGTDGWVDFLQENEDQDDQDAQDEDGQEDLVDYKELNLIKNVNEGDLVARVHAPTPGEDGFTVLGKVLKARSGKPARVRAGKNIKRSEDGSEIYAATNGFVVKDDDRLSIENVYVVDQVDASTGNIRFAGVVAVRHGVEDNFTVEAAKGIDVGGAVGKATLKSESDINIRGGVMGGTLEAKNNISAKFLSECNVNAGENVTVRDYILHSDVQAGKTVQVTKAFSGFINGGITRAGDMVASSNLGSDVGEEKTQIEVGVRPNLRQVFDGLQRKLQRNQVVFDKLSKNLLVQQNQREKQGEFDEEKQESFNKSLAGARRLRDDLFKDLAHYHEMANELAQSTMSIGIVFAENLTNPGVTVQIKFSRVTIKSPIVGSAFKIMRGELKVQDHDEAMKLYKNLLAKPQA